ncbi:acetyl-CoA carboxylase carboxyltransferase subunit alpha [Sphaerisporangium siamense]|uniref:Multifunctional fusion protein n=1 Tax=Sphaerisporangium siamense TaxID=795645 RepID=A0A7W7D571_9ACTN|nr:acetyl-CoA carboxylase carboxyltransferase subunit alpha [Sphaerisporangium siamense]MBB4699111.1 acetyl-CoA carboxylase carboxyl transferase subunit beta [Sphaerisporangium siamense]
MTSVLSRPVTDRSGDENQWTKCPSCTSLLYLRRLRRQDWVCPECTHPLRLSVADRLEMLLDPGSFRRHDADLEPVDVLGFADSKPYPKRIAEARERTGANESVVWGTGTIEEMPLVVAVMAFEFMGGSVGGVSGELIARAARHALAARLPLLLVTASGGARMQEGAISLMQLAKTAQELGRLREAGLLCVNLLTDPTYGGATASFAVLGDIVLAEPSARIGFAGPGVIKQTIRQDLPKNFQRAESLLACGMIDDVVPRDRLRPTLGRLLRLHSGAQDDTPAPAGGVPYLTDPITLDHLPATEVVRTARNIDRPTTLDYCAQIFDEFFELRGDRCSGDDKAIVGGVASLGGRPVVVIGHQKGHETPELIRRNFGMPQPSGYHKARRLMDHAERFGMPVVTFVDTPGAYPGVEAEERGQGTAIAECILRMSRLRVPVVSVVTGEGGSGGALALATANRLLILGNAYFSVISPEGCATILFGSAGQADRAAAELRLTARDLLELGVVDGVVPEPAEGAHDDWAAAGAAVREAVVAGLAELSPLSADNLVKDRYARHTRFGDPNCQPSVTRW